MVEGTRYHTYADHLVGMHRDQQLNLIREPDNPYDPNAIAVYHMAHRVGYLPRTLAAELAPQMDQGIIYIALTVRMQQANNFRIRVKKHPVQRIELLDKNIWKDKLPVHQHTGEDWELENKKHLKQLEIF